MDNGSASQATSGTLECNNSQCEAPYGCTGPTGPIGGTGSKTIVLNTAQPKNLCEYLKRRKVMWITFTIIVLVIIITIPIVTVKTKKKNSEETSTTEPTTTSTPTTTSSTSTTTRAIPSEYYVKSFLIAKG
ncbi:unnamed protein product [Adineta steineri]|uniref:Uncharacterized protein n=1 Tax=Adineta steineri TaxID=433720 RepID=A0A814AA69_9BILA|nr:unnamed protein product [Adineta steineri]CAF0841919.1 unnamed protein product [Adineta steineri]CAF0911380.1 unnamed protein product [Adineta steineri]